MIRRACLVLPTNRECAATIHLLAQEADYAVRHFGVEVCLLILDTCVGEALSRNLQAIRELPPYKNVIPVHFDAAEQKSYLRKVIDGAGIHNTEQMLNFMMPVGVSYGACTNRAFLISRSLGCDSVHRRDSDSRYQVVNGEIIFPIHQELISLGKKAEDVKSVVSEVLLGSTQGNKPVVMAGGTFIGEMSVDIGEIYSLNREIYYDIVSLWADNQCSLEEKRELVDISFKGAGNDKFIEDWSALSTIDSMRIDMCNIGFYQVYEDVPLLPAVDTIGSDYFLIHAVECVRLPGVHHNRHIENFYTPLRKTDAGFMAYNMRLTKFFLSMMYLNDIYKNMARAGESLLDPSNHILVPPIIEMARQSLQLDKRENESKLNVLINSYIRLGGRYKTFAEQLAGQRHHLLSMAEQDINDFIILMEAWASLINAGKENCLLGADGERHWLLS